MWAQYERETYQFLTVYRFLSYALAVMFSQLPLSIISLGMSDLQIYVILAVLGAYTLLKVFSPLRWRERSPMTYLILAGDFVLCMLLVIYTRGLNSVFLLYSLTPIMTASLLFEEKIALSLAAAASLSLSITHLTLSQFGDRITGLLQGYNLTLLIIYTLFSFVSATVPYRMNMNIRRRIEREAIIEERRRIGREIHDGVAQALSYLNLKTKEVKDQVSSHKTEQAVRGLDEIRDLVKDTYEGVRESIDQLSAEARRLPLIPALADYTREFSEKSSIPVQFRVARAYPRLSPVAELQLLRIVQESLTNVRRHAGATEATVRLENTDQTVELIIKDNGRGFTLLDLEHEQSASGYHGLNIIKERAEGLGGSLTVSTAPGEGTEVKISLPIEKVRL